MTVLNEDQRRRLNRAAVVDGALALADADGFDALTIRRLAERLGVTPMALYWHFKNKDQLLHAVVDRIWSLVDITTDSAAPWLDRLGVIMDSLITALRAHPGVTSLLMNTDMTKTESCFSVMEAAMAILADAGFGPAEQAEICRHGLRTAITLAAGEPPMPNEHNAEFLRHKRIALRSLPEDRYPHVIEAADALTDCEDPDAYYRFGLGLFLAGIAAQARG